MFLILPSVLHVQHQAIQFLKHVLLIASSNHYVYHLVLLLILYLTLLTSFLFLK